MPDDNCGWPTADGTACEHPATDDKTGRCWQHCDDAKKGGRPSKFNDKRAREVIQAAKECKSIRGCGRAAGVVENTILNWLRENPEFAKRSVCPDCQWETEDSNIPKHCPRCESKREEKISIQPRDYREFLRAFMRARAEAETLLTRGPLSRPDEIDGQHARFLLKTSFGYQDSLELLIDDFEEGKSTEDTVSELESIFED